MIIENDRNEYEKKYNLKCELQATSALLFVGATYILWNMGISFFPAFESSFDNFWTIYFERALGWGYIWVQIFIFMILQIFFSYFFMKINAYIGIMIFGIEVLLISGVVVYRLCQM